jgi:RHS repeat-associated protein
LNYQYDEANNKIQTSDKINGQDKGVTNYVYDPNNRATQINQSGNGVRDKRVDFSYDAMGMMMGQITGMTRYSNLAGTLQVASSSYQYDNAGRLTGLKHSHGQNTIANYGWSYDSGSRVTSFTNGDGSSNYSYDKSNQLTATDHSNQNDEAYIYDKNGNRTGSGYVTGVNNQLLNDGKYNYEYDSEGNRTKKTEIATGIVDEYVWDYRNRLTNVVSLNSSGNVIKSAEYTYDAFDKRIAKSVDADGDGAGSATVERFVYDGNNIALTFDGQGNQTHRYLYGTGVDSVIADEKNNGEVLWALSDNLGSVRDVVNSNGVVRNHYVYDSFGSVIGETNPGVDFRFGYVGKELDSETGLRRNGIRYVEEDRFISPDPIGFAGYDSNLYRYVLNSPTNLTDPTGNIAIVDDALIITGAAAAATWLWYNVNQLLNPPGGTLTPPPPDSQTDSSTPKAPPQLLPKPQPRPKPDQDDEPKAPPPENPSDCDDKPKKNCATVYPQYDRLSDYVGSQFPFGGFKDKSLNSAIGAMKNFRGKHPQIHDFKALQSDPLGSSPMDTRFMSQELKFLENLKDPERSGQHYNVFIKELLPQERKSAGSVAKYKFCIEGNPPQLDWRFSILNIKDDNGYKYYHG